MFEFKQYEQKTITQDHVDKLDAQLKIYRINAKKYEEVLNSLAAVYNNKNNNMSQIIPISSDKLQDCYDSLQMYKIMLDETTYKIGDSHIQAITKMEILSTRIKDIRKRLDRLNTKDYTSDLYNKENQRHADDLLTMSIKSDIHPKYKKAFKVISKHLDKINVLDYEFILSDNLYTNFDELSLLLLYKFRGTTLPFEAMHLKYDYQHKPIIMRYDRKPEHDSLVNGLDKIFCKVTNKHLVEYNAQKKLELINFFLHKYFYDNNACGVINAINPSMKQYID